ncbi:MAG TPA: ornithine carbamoyltransferase [Thermoanaerobaculia bacterium]|nr:ornithine carbamoyltransferase [Thermoanaerobaculia bacterium]
MDPTRPPHPALSVLEGRSFLTLRDQSRETLEALIDLALQMKSGAVNQALLAGKTLGMLFTVPSTRTRISFQVAARQLGAHAEHLTPADLQMSNHETLQDTAAVMGRLLDGIVVRLYDLTQYGKGYRSLEEIGRYAAKPVINALDDREHPCQVLADILTLRERFGADYRQRTVVFSWAWAKRQKSPGVTHSMLAAAAILGMRLRMVFPPGFEPEEDYLRFAREQSERSGGSLELCHDLDTASAGADAIYAKSWKALSCTAEEDAALRAPLREAWRVSERHFERAAPGAVFMDCMPLIRGDEATAGVVDGPQSIRYDQAENRLHIQKAILASVLGSQP